MNVRHCPSCMKEWTVPSHIVEVFHYCEHGGPDGLGQRRRIRTLPSRVEARSELWHALLEAQGPDSIWRPLGGVDQ